MADDGSSSSPSLLAGDIQAERACFDGTLLSAVAYGALLMLYIQLAQVLLSRPKRGKTFWAIVGYSSTLFPLATFAVGGMIKFMEMSYIDGRNFIPDGPGGFHKAFSSDSVNMMSQICTTLVPWFGDILMLYRLMVVWNYRWWIAVFPGLLYISRVAMSIPLLISQTKPLDSVWAAKSDVYGTAFYSLCVSLNLFITIMISVRLHMMRRKVETVMGKLHASFYTGTVTMLVESGAFFTLWAIIYVVLRARNSFVKEIFLLPYTYILGITRMLIILRMAQDRAWSKDLVTATAGGVLDWHVSSTHSIPMHDVPASSMASLQSKTLPRKFREDDFGI